MSFSSPQLRRVVRHALTETAGTPTPTISQLGAAFGFLCDRFHATLRPLFGATATTALFTRARHLAGVEFAWIGDVVPHNGTSCVIHDARAPDAPEEIADGLIA